MEDFITIDCDRLRRDLMDFLEGAYLVAGFGVAMVERMKVETCSDEELVQIALSQGFRIQNYMVEEKGKSK